MSLLDILRSFDPNVVAYGFIVFMLFAFVLAIWTIGSQKHPRYQQFAPNLLTTVGILGTFVGISIGLAGFDTNLIDESIPTLLNGLKTAFITSIVGMTLSILTKAFATWNNREDETAGEDVGAAELHTVLREIRSGILQGNALTDKTRQAIAGDGDASVVTQLQKVRTEINDNSKEMQRKLSVGMQGESIGVAIEGIGTNINNIGEKVAEEFRRFAEKVSEIGSKQLVQALEEVIRDFNRNLMEQFGENFKHLDQSVQKLVVWQDQYGEQLDQMDKQFQETVKGLAVSKDAVAEISEKVSVIPESMTAFLAVMKSAGVQLQNLEAHLGAFADMREKAVGAMPEIKKQLDDVMETVQASVKRASDHYEIMLSDSSEANEKFKQAAAVVQERFANETEAAITKTNDVLNKTVSSLHDGGKAVTESASQVSEKVSGAVDELSTKIDQSISRSFEDQNAKLQQLQGGLRDAVAKAAEDQTQLITQITENMDAKMQEELTRVIQLMANSLGAITGKFVDDYMELTTNMQKVVESNRRVGQ